ncbi:MAG: isochorismate synthase [Gemmatimonadetes bacterium]|nr:isochorismate synthase [Gemmatimonadota bacterium]MDA1103506.1 isochorismate synthase [Gemmatimonadota bacterium]
MARASDRLRLATVTIPAPDLRPENFLRHAAGEERGFWAHGRRWVAHRGVAAELRGGAGAEGDRFDEVAAAARALALHPILADGSARAARVRFYGGFSFRPDHEAVGVWSEFPAWLFHLPVFELEGDDSGDAWLRARALVPEEGAADVLARLRRRAEALRAELTTHGEITTAPFRATGRATATDRSSWEGAVSASLVAIRTGVVSKAVLARTLDVDLDTAIDPVDVVSRLWEVNRGSHVFLFEPSSGSALLGAAPETVATLRDGVFHATAVAGSIRRGASPREQTELAARLLASEKDRAEQRIALDDMVARLETVAHQIRTDPQPHVLTLAGIQHLETEIRASVPGGVSVLDLLRLLHPTPAVCGLPRDAAMAFLAEEEPFERGWYAGPVGWFDAEGNGVFAPALRTGVSTGSGWRLFAGAGIVEGSVPALEWEETGIKFEPMLGALRDSGAVLDQDAEAGRTESSISGEA